jgi:hypothetical protein
MYVLFVINMYVCSSDQVAQNRKIGKPNNLIVLGAQESSCAPKTIKINLVLPKLLNYLAFQSFDFELPDEGYSRNVHVH